MLSPYRALLAIPGTRAFVLAGFVGRFPISMLGLGAVLLITARTGSYGLAGAVSAVMALSTAVAGPVAGRIADTHGQSRVVLPMVALHALGVLGLVAAVLRDAPAVVLFAPAVLAGASVPQIGSMVRARWATLVAGTPRMSTAFSLESALDECVFVAGPVTATLLSTLVWAPSGLLVALGLAIVGGVAFAAQRGTEPPRQAVEAGPRIRAISVPGLRVLVATFAFVGAIFGVADISIVAFASEHGHRATSGLILATFATGSLIAGIGYGAVHWRAALRTRFLRAVICLMLGTLPIALAPNIDVLLVAVVVCGLAISPTIVAGMGLVESLVPARSLTEGFTWVNAAMGVGVSIGSSVAGRVVDATDGHRALLLTTTAAVVAAAIAVATRRHLVTDPSADARPSRPTSAVL